jgi:hypothetical protein
MFKKQDSIFITYTHPNDQKRRSNRRAVSSFVSKSYRPTSRKIVFDKTQYRPFLASTQRSVAAPESTVSVAPKAKRAIPKTRNTSTASASPRPSASPAPSHHSELTRAPPLSLEHSIVVQSQSTASSPSFLPFTPSPEPELNFQDPPLHRTPTRYPDPRPAQSKSQQRFHGNLDPHHELSYPQPREPFGTQRHSRAYLNANGICGFPELAASSSQTPYASSQTMAQPNELAFALPETEDSLNNASPWWYDYNFPSENIINAWNEPQRW